MSKLKLTLLILLLFTSIIYPSTSIYTGLLTTHIVKPHNYTYNESNQVLILEQRSNEYSVIVLHMINSIHRESYGVLAGKYITNNIRLHVGLVSGYDSFVHEEAEMEGVFIGNLMIMCVFGVDIPITLDKNIQLSINYFIDGINIGLKYNI